MTKKGEINLNTCKINSTKENDINSKEGKINSNKDKINQNLRKGGDLRKGRDQLNVIGFLSQAKLSPWMHTAVNTGGEKRFFYRDYTKIC